MAKNFLLLDEVRASKSQTVYFNVIENPIDINLNLNVNGVDRKEAASGNLFIVKLIVNIYLLNNILLSIYVILSIF